MMCFGAISFFALLFLAASLFLAWLAWPNEPGLFAADVALCVVNVHSLVNLWRARQ